MDQNFAYRLAVALLIGLLIGLQREYAHRPEKTEGQGELFAGARTFALVSLLGFLAAFVNTKLESYLGLVIIFGAVAALVVTSYTVSARKGDLGITTEVSALIAFVIGGFAYWGELTVAAACGVLTTILLSLKVSTKTLAANLTREDVLATLKFAFISVIVLPLLSKESIGPSPFDVIVPFNVWLMVVFISGISFLGYALIKIIGFQKGIGLTGILGGLASSTAVTISFSQRSKTIEGFAQPFALAIFLSWLVMIFRVTAEIATINAGLLAIMWPPLLVVIVCSVLFCAYLYSVHSERDENTTDRFTNPFELRPAILFGIFYVGILLLSNVAQVYYGSTGIYLSSIVAGLVDVDAITLSMARLSQQSGNLDMATAARAIVFAFVTNTLVKGGIVLVVGSKELKKVVIPGLILITASALISVLLLT